ncbi:MAG: transposase [Bacteroidota bacterium]
MELFAWCIMTNHVHLMFRSIQGTKSEILLGDFKRFTSRNVVKAIQENQRESRKEWCYLSNSKKQHRKSQIPRNINFGVMTTNQ